MSDSTNVWRFPIRVTQKKEKRFDKFEKKISNVFMVVTESSGRFFW